MDLGLKDKVVVITGGAGAIGSAAAECFLREGCEEVGEWIVLAASRIGRPLTGQDLRVTSGIEAGGFNRRYETAAVEVE